MKRTTIGRRQALLVIGAVIWMVFAAGSASAQPDDAALVAALRAGGFTLYFRHAETDWSQQDHVSKPGDWKSCDGTRVRQHSDIGRQTAKRVGQALRALNIPVDRVLSSEYCRAVLATPPPAGANTVITAHGNLMRAATGAYPQEAGAGVFIADGSAEYGFKLVAELTPADWARLAERFGGN